MNNTFVLSTQFSSVFIILSTTELNDLNRLCLLQLLSRSQSS